MSSCWVVDPEVLIIEVECRPILYSKALPDYFNKIMKNKAWENITKKLSEDWETLSNEAKSDRCKDVQAKWKHLRDNFRREYLAQKDVTSGQGAKKRKKYGYYDELLFLVPHIKDAKTSGNYRTPTNSEQNIESESTPNTMNSPAEPLTDTPNVLETPNKKKQTKSTFEDEVVRTINNDKSEMDEDKSFCLSLVQSLKKMNDDNKMLAKIEILKVLRTFSNKSINTNISQLNRSPNVEPYFTHPNSTIYTQTPQHSTFTQSHNMYQQHSESHPTLSLHRSSAVKSIHPSKVIKILENRQFRTTNSAAPSYRPHSAQSFFTTFNPNTCPYPSYSDQSILTSDSPLSDVKSPEELLYIDQSSSNSVKSPLGDVKSPEELLYTDQSSSNSVKSPLGDVKLPEELLPLDNIFN